jgi:LmbE family N-acetylglucosaminyl deacetylase
MLTLRSAVVATVCLLVPSSLFAGRVVLQPEELHLVTGERTSVSAFAHFPLVHGATCRSSDAATVVVSGGIDPFDTVGDVSVRAVRPGYAALRCSVWNADGTFEVVSIPVTITNPVCPPAITLSTDRIRAVVGQQVTVSISWVGVEPTGFAWYEGATGDTSRPVRTASGPLLHVETGRTGVRSYWARVTTPCANIDTDTVRVTTFECSPPTVATHPVSVSVDAGETATLQASAGGSEPFTYTWYRRVGSAPPVALAETDGTIEIETDVKATYWAVIENPCGTVTTNEAVVTPLTRRRLVDRRRSFPAVSSLAWIGAHPDDEIFVAPLLGQICVEQNGNCIIAAATRGEQGQCALPGGCGGDLGALRSNEAAASAGLLRSRLHLFNFADSRGETPDDVIAFWSAQAGGRSALVKQFADLIRTSGAAAVVTFDPRHGSTCHPDHRAVGQLVIEAVDSLGAAAPELWLLESNLDASTSRIGFVPAVQNDPAVMVFDAASRWGYVEGVLGAHPSQYNATTVSLVRAAPADLRRVYLARSTTVLRNESYAGLCGD